MGELRQLNEQTKLALWAEQIRIRWTLFSAS